MKYDLVSFQEKLKTLFPNNKIQILQFEGTYGYMKYQCLECGRIYEKTRANHAYENQTLCSHCYSARNSKLRNWILKFLKINKQFTLVEKWNGNTGDNLILHCNQCDSIFSKQPANLFQRKINTICPICGDNSAPVSFEQFFGRLNEVQQQEYKFLNYTTMGKSCKIKHQCGFVFSQKPLNFIKGRGCPKCHKKFSRGEEAILNFCATNNIKCYTQYRFEDFKKYSYDFYLPDHNLLIEYNGKQHYAPVEHWGGDETYEKQKQRDALKIQYAQQHAIQLLTIPYTEFQNLNTILASSTTNCSAKRHERRDTQMCDDIV